MDHLKFSNRHAGDVGKARDTGAIEQGCGIPAPERLDHASILTSRVSIVNGRAGTASGSDAAIGRRAAPWAALVALLLASAWAGSCQLGFSCNVRPSLVAHYAGLFGPGARSRLEAWKELGLANAARSAAAREGSGELELLTLVNRYFNRLPAATDIALWGVEDYWATPSEFLSIGAGDCEDYTIAKYFTLKEAGIPVSRLRLVYVRISAPGPQSGHMVLAYYADPRADPLILDNLNGNIQPASRRTDLVPVFSFNDDDLRFPGNAMVVQMNPSSVRLWQILTEKLVREMAY